MERSVSVGNREAPNSEDRDLDACEWPTGICGPHDAFDLSLMLLRIGAWWSHCSEHYQRGDRCCYRSVGL